jgi:ribosomal protein S4
VVVPAELDGRPLDAVVRALFALSHGAARKAVETGKVSIDDDILTLP